MFPDLQPLSWRLSPLDLLARWRDDRPVVVLHSGRYHPRWARWTIFAQPAGWFRSIVKADGSTQSQREGEVGVEAFTHRPFADLRQCLTREGGVWIGYLSYDLARYIERLPTHATRDRDWPLIELAWCPDLLLHDNATGQWWAKGWAGEAPAEPVVSSAGPCDFMADHLRSDFGRESYITAIKVVKEHIAAGDIFQANLAQRFTADFAGRFPHAARSLFTRLASISPAWYGAYLELPPECSPEAGSPSPRRALASTSPELFLQLAESGWVTTRPIKGTLPASRDPQDLARSEKDAAELHMIVDLMRNDLGKVCDYGSVKVVEPRAIETHPTIHHGVATIEGRLHPTKNIVDLLRATLPGGSVTGAPKVRAMQIIDELEPVRRGPYCGAIGWLTPRSACLNLAIRTVTLESTPAPGSGPTPTGRIDFSVGGGIVADSDPAAEYQETLDKAAALFAALNLSAMKPPAAEASHPSMA